MDFLLKLTTMKERIRILIITGPNSASDTKGQATQAGHHVDHACCEWFHWVKNAEQVNSGRGKGECESLDPLKHMSKLMWVHLPMVGQRFGAGRGVDWSGEVFAIEATVREIHEAGLLSGKKLAAGVHITRAWLKTIRWHCAGCTGEEVKSLGMMYKI